MSGAFGFTSEDALLVRAAHEGRIESRQSVGYEQDRKPQGWSLFVVDGRVADDSAEAAIQGLLKEDLLAFVDEDADSTQLVPTGEGRTRAGAKS